MVCQINETGQNDQIVTYYEIAHGELAEGQGNYKSYSQQELVMMYK